MPEFAAKVGKGVWKLDVWVQPNAAKNDVAGLYQGCLKLRIQAPAADNKANRMLASYVAHLLGLRKNQVELARGHTGRKKTLTIHADNEPSWPRVARDGV